MATSVQDPTDVSVWNDGRAVDPLAWRWHGPALAIALAMALATAIVSMSDGLEVRDTDKMLSGRIVLLLGTLGFFIVIDLIPRAIKRPGPFHVTLPAVARERWSRRRAGAVCLGMVSFYVTYLSYRNLKGFLPFLTDQDFDPALLSLDRHMFLGHDPGPLLHSLLGTGIAAHLLSSVYLFFLAFVPISLGAALIASSNPIPGLWYVTALGINWTLGVVSYLVIPALGPAFAAPNFYANLPETGTAALQQALIYERHEALAGQAAQSIAAFASLHVSVVFTAALIAQLLHLNRFLRAALWTFLGLTMLATLYFGWHYLVDDIAGLGIGVIAVVFAGVATGHLRLRIPVRWRSGLPNALTLGRIAIIPAVVWLLLDNAGLSVTAAALFALASLTDACDGHLARRWHVQSVFGTLADPFADKLLILGSLVALASAGRVPVWVVVLIASREIWATLLRMHARRHGVVIAAGPLGKAKMVVQVFTLFALMAVDLNGVALELPLFAMVAITIGSGIEIALRARQQTALVPARAARAIAGAS
ncbi:MAG: CDP-diacylglycerol--glycerol-3-phosphate 3-phosphatidyltransferase [Solirubrobacteraceae bacterium]